MTRKSTWRNAQLAAAAIVLAVLGLSIASDVRSNQDDHYGRLWNARVRQEPVQPKVPWIVIKEQPQAQAPASEAVTIDGAAPSLQTPATAVQSFSDSTGYISEPLPSTSEPTVIAPAGAAPLLRDGSTRERVSITGGAGGVHLEVTRR